MRTTKKEESLSSINIITTEAIVQAIASHRYKVLAAKR